MAQRALAQACLYSTGETRKRNLHPILIMLRTMPILMISTMTIMMISGTMRTRKTTGKRIIDLQPEIITGLQRDLSTLQAGYMDLSVRSGHGAHGE